MVRAFKQIKARLFEILPKKCCGATLLQKLYDCKLEN
jgi:hypothetical protein